MKGARLLALLFTLLFLLPLFVCPCAALSLDELLPDLLEAMPNDTQKELEGISDPSEVRELLGIEHLTALVFSAVREGLSRSLATFARLFAAVLLASVLGLFAQNMGASAARAAECAIAAVLAATVFSIARADMDLLVSTLSDMRVLSDGLLPLFATLLAAGGSAGAATAAATGFATLSYVITHVIAAVLQPMFGFLFGLSTLSAFGGDGRTEGLVRTVKGLYLTVLLFLSVLLVTSLGFQSTLSASADSLAVGSVRFAVGNLIPVVGSTLGGSLRTLSASLSLIRSTLGTLALAALLLSVLPVLVSLLLHRFFLSLSADVAGMLGAQSVRRILDGTRTVYDLAAATLALALVLFFFILAILCHSVMAIG